MHRRTCSLLALGSILITVNACEPYYPGAGAPRWQVTYRVATVDPIIDVAAPAWVAVAEAPHRFHENTTTDFEMVPATIESQVEQRSGDLRWARALGGSNQDSISAIALGDNGSRVVTGYFSGSADFGCGIHQSSGAADMFVTKTSSAGACIWSSAAGWPASLVDGAAIATDSDGSIFVGGTAFGGANFGASTIVPRINYQGFVGAFDGQGQNTWVLAIASTQDVRVRGIHATAKDLFVTGELTGQLSLQLGKVVSRGESDAFVMRISKASGQPIWTRVIAGEASIIARDVVADERTVVVVGDFAGDIEMGRFARRARGGRDAFLAKLDLDGEGERLSAIGGELDDTLQSVSITAEGDVYAGGSFQDSIVFADHVFYGDGSHTGFVAKYDEAGNEIWGQKLDAQISCKVWDIAVSKRGHLYATGSFAGTSYFDETAATANDTDAFVAHLDASEARWFVALSGPGAEVGTSIALSEGSISVGGYFDQAFSFSGHTRESSGGFDGMLAEIVR